MRRLVVYKWLVNYQAQDTRRFFSWSFIPLKKNPFDIDLGNEIITSFLKQKRQKRFKGFDLRVFCLHICLDICRSKTKYRKKLYHSYGTPLHDISNEGKWWVDRIQYNVSASYVLSLIFFSMESTLRRVESIFLFSCLLLRCPRSLTQCPISSAESFS